MTSTPNEVDRPVTIAVVGTHSTGKTTFLSRLADDLRRDRIEVAVVEDLGSQAHRIGLPILYHHTWASTLWIMTRGISTELEAWLHADVVLVDRGVPDALGYYEAALAYQQRQPDPRLIQRLEQMAIDHSRHYDQVLRTVLNPEVPIGSDKPRDTDLRFRELADKHVAEVLHRLGIGHDVLPFDGHDRAIVEALALIKGRLEDPAAEFSWDDSEEPTSVAVHRLEAG
ncbi:AAA family ATPase [Nocardia terpenica]|uniref:AAA family ATPase n=1 Tax=Nocardia terpenica TaxID=455432 RepID=UPI0015C5233B|nr:AAA family ATPase [Nocardia terpenica]NQE88074.1 AAA family ATPase [Nocardia terpenica]